MAMPDLGDPAGRAFLDEVIESHRIDLVVLDSLSTLVRSGEENDAGPWVPIQEWALKQRGRGVTMLFVHHESRAGNPRGTSKREDVLDSMIKLKARPALQGAEESTYDLSFTKTREFHGSDAAARVVRLSMRSGTIKWTSQPADESTRDRVFEMIERGYRQAEIAAELGITPGRVSQLAKEAPTKRATEHV
jgi:putative DNA primase/helicase